MEKKTKFLLGLSILLLIGGLLVATDVIDPLKVPFINVMLPLGVIAAGAALVVQLLESDSRRAVADQKRTLERAGIQVPESQTPAKQGAVLAQ
jgi:hypothetical protein